MKSIISRCYAILLILSLVLVVSVLMDFGMDITERRLITGYEFVEDYEYSRVADLQAPVGFREEYVFVFDEVDGGYRTLFFYTEHRNIDVYVNGDRVYRLRPFINNSFGKTPGCGWNSVALEENEEGATVRVVTTPLYESVVGETPHFYFGEKYEIARVVLLEQIPTLLLCFIGILMGLFFIFYSAYKHKGSEMDRALMALGCLAAIISLWKLTDNVALYMLFETMPGLYLSPLVFVQLGVIPFVLLAKELNGVGNEKIWYAPVVFSFGATVITLFLQIMDVCDIRQMLWLVYLEWLAACLVVVWMIILRMRKQGWDVKKLRDSILLIACLVLMVIDTGVFKISSISSWLGMAAFIAYVLLMGVFTVKDTKALMEIGIQAQNFERKAYHDQLTGLYNRTAYMDYVSQESFGPEKCIVVVFDLNNLKKYNDLLGHSVGDRYIKECAELIQRSFGEVGRCYRMGGDEFSVIIEKASLEDCKKRIKMLKASVEERNVLHPEMVMGIACGYELYDSRLDHDISDTFRRADKMMYREKYAMKQMQVLQ
ncbi:MAG: GGDEF domain-containing protein [Lachnospiraceae bacterium]|nr:GGDEF domain-containing protein [Lachnospiraceae bacterium]